MAGKYEFNGEKYKNASKHQKEWGSKLISELKLQGKEEVLDIGCGDGVLTEQIAALLPDGKAVGLDASEGMIETANQLKKPNLSFVCMDINEMSFENQFDLIFSNAALHWVHDHKKLLDNCMKALKENGKIAWNFAASGTCLTFNEIAGTVMELPEYQTYFTDFIWPWTMLSKKEYVDLMAGMDFLIYDVQKEITDRYFADSEEMIKWIDQPCLVPFLQVLPADKKESFREKVIERMVERTRQPDGRHFEYFRRLKIKAVK